MRFFNAVRAIKDDWDKPETSIISLGLGVGALINVMQILFVKLFIEECNFNAEKVINFSKEELQLKLKGLENVNFSKDGPFGRTSGASSISNIKEEIGR